MSTILILNAHVVNEGQIIQKDVFVKDGFIDQIGGDLRHLKAQRVIDANGKHLLPGIIDDQVHFREPGLTHKATIYSEARAAVAGGVTSFMEMPNTVPNALTQALLADKYEIGARTSLANYSFFMGVSNDNYDELMQTDIKNVCGLKIFMGSSTGNMLVDNIQVLEKVFANAPCLIATHCEDEATIKRNTEYYKTTINSPSGGKGATAALHPLVRNEEACYKSSSFAVELAKKHNTRLHVLHISTGEETELFSPPLPEGGAEIIPPSGVRGLITAEACVHHLWFSADDYERLGNQIKCNPAIKAAHHKAQILQALLDDRIAVIATDHAPHTWEEKQQPYWQAPSGLPLVQHSLNMMLELAHENKISMTRVVEKMCHAVADCFEIDRRGYVREGYWADLVLVDLAQTTTVSRENVLYHCGWSPLEGTTFHSCITHSIVSGHLAYANGQFDESKKGQRLAFLR